MLTVVMTTRDGERTLPRVLDAYCALEAPEGGWKLCVVDNGSTDGTPRILDGYAGRLPLTRFVESRRGQNRARNAALGAIEGDLVVLADDDAVPRADWLAALRRAADAHPEFGIFGGAIRPLWEHPPEEWVLRWVPPGAGFALTDPAWPEGPIRPSWIFSPNMAMRAAVFARGHRFDERFGPREGSYAMGSETEMTERLAREGVYAWHVAGAVVEHIIRPHQMTEDWLLSRAVRFGRGQYRLLVESGRLRPPVLGVPLASLRGVASHAGRLFVARCRRNPEAAFRWRWNLRCSIGSVLEALAIGRERRPGQARA